MSTASGHVRPYARATPYLFVLPFALLLGVFVLYPLLVSLSLSVHKTNGAFVGLANYRFLLHDRVFWWAAANTVLFTVAFLAVHLPTALVLALLLRRLRGRNIFRWAFFSTYLVGQVFGAVLFAMLLGPHGWVNRVLGMHVLWLENPRLTMIVMLVAAWWLSVGYAMVYFLAALSAVDPQLYDASALDGAGAWAQFCHVTLPGIRPVLIFLMVAGTIAAMQLFELPYVLFHGAGPNYSALTLVTYLFMVGFEAGDLGYAAAIGWALVLLLFVVALVQVRVTGVSVEDQHA